MFRTMLEREERPASDCRRSRRDTITGVRPMAVVLAVVAVIGGSVLASCASPPPKPEFPELTWAHLPAYKLDVAEIEVVSEYEPSFKPPHVEHLFPLPPEQALRRWADDRLEAGGTEGRAKVIIKKAGVVEMPLETRKDLEGYLTVEQSERYDAEVQMTVEVRNARGYRDAYVTATAKRSETAPEDMTLNEREKLWFSLTEALMKDFNAAMETEIEQYLGRYLR